jgi:LAGLIDADG endonuclease
MTQATMKKVHESVDRIRSTTTLAELGWLAGIIDGEGCITIVPRLRSDASCRNHGYSMKVAVSNTDPRMILKIKSILGFGSIQCKSEHRNGRCKAAYVWITSCREALVFLLVIKDHLVTKAEQAQLAIEIQNRTTTRMGMKPANGPTGKGRVLSIEEASLRRGIFDQIKILNRKGPDRGNRVAPYAEGIA